MFYPQNRSHLGKKNLLNPGLDVGAGAGPTNLARTGCSMDGDLTSPPDFPSVLVNWCKCAVLWSIFFGIKLFLKFVVDLKRTTVLWLLILCVPKISWIFTTCFGYQENDPKITPENRIQSEKSGLIFLDSPEILRFLPEWFVARYPSQAVAPQFDSAWYQQSWQNSISACDHLFHKI